MYSVVTANRNRLDHLRKSLATWQRVDRIAEIVVVDFGSNRPISVADFADPQKKIKIVRVENTDEWRLGLAYNIGIDHATRPLICKLDSDIAIANGAWLDAADAERCFYRGRYTGSVSHGQVILARRHWQQVGGYHEWVSGWGADDTDFYIRLRRHGIPEREIDPGFLTETIHAHDIRTPPKITTEFFRLDPIDPQTRMLFTGSRNTYLINMYPWSAGMRLTYAAQQVGEQLIRVDLPVMPQAHRRGVAFANFLGLVRLRGSEEQNKLLAAMIAQFLSEDGGM
jgi:glycosyltransferase involved in cell wall biosynthesis